MSEKQSTLTGIDKKYRYIQLDGDYPKIIKGDLNYCFAFPFDAQMLCEELNELVDTIERLTEENQKLKKQNHELIEGMQDTARLSANAITKPMVEVRWGKGVYE